MIGFMEIMMKKKSLVAIAILIFCCVVLVLYKWLSSDKLVRLYLDEKGMIRDGASLIPLARFDRLDVVAKVGDDGRVMEPYRFICERKRGNGDTEKEELIIIPVKAGEPVSVSVANKWIAGRIVGKLPMPDRFVGERIACRVERNVAQSCEVIVDTGIWGDYVYGHPHGETVPSQIHNQLLSPQSGLWPIGSCARHGAVLLLINPMLMDLSAVTDDDMHQVEGDEHLCWAWYITEDGSFLMMFFVRELGSLKNLVRGRIEGKFDLMQNRIIEQHIVYEPKELRNISIRVSAHEEKESQEGMIRVVFQHGKLCSQEDFPVSKFIRKHQLCL